MNASSQPPSATMDEEVERFLLLAAERLRDATHNSSGVTLRMGIAHALSSTKQGYEEAERLCESVLDYQPGNKDAATTLVQLAAMRGAYDLVIKRAARAKRIAPGNVLLERLEGVALFNLGQDIDAIRVLENVADLHPRNFDVRLELAVTLRKSGRLDKAADQFEKLRTDFPKRDIVWSHAVSLMLQMRKFARVIELCDKAPNRSIDMSVQKACAFMSDVSTRGTELRFS